jgi:hypothetical protein
VKTFIKHKANVKVNNIKVGFIFQCQIINSEKTTMFNMFVQMMRIFQLKRRVILESQTAIQPVMTFQTFHANSGFISVSMRLPMDLSSKPDEFSPYPRTLFLSIILIPSFLIFEGYLMAFSISRLYSVKRYDERW